MPRGMEEKLCSSEHGRTHRQEVTIALSMAGKSCIGRLALMTTSPALQELWEDFFLKKSRNGYSLLSYKCSPFNSIGHAAKKSGQ